MFQIFNYNYNFDDRRFEAAISRLLKLLLTMPNHEYFLTLHGISRKNNYDNLSKNCNRPFSNKSLIIRLLFTSHLSPLQMMRCSDIDNLNSRSIIIYKPNPDIGILFASSLCHNNGFK